jgi:polyisoprenoid-binding protein YceI
VDVGYSINTIVSNSIKVLLVLACSASFVAAGPAERGIDSPHSSLKVYVYKTGFFSVFAHNHVIEAPVESGDVTESGAPAVELRVDARKLRVLDPEVAQETRAEIQQTMQGPKVLDADRFPEIHFQSATVEMKGANHWIVNGNLDLHGQTRPVTVDVTLKDGVYRGSATLKQTAFGIVPVRIAGGTVKVKDEVKVEFEIALAN